MFDIVKYPNRLLKKKCAAVAMVGDEERDTLRRMLKAMYLNKGIGLAAPQVGINKKLAVVDIGDKKVVRLINPSITKLRGSEAMEEGCLSIPGAYVNVKRPSHITVESLDENGRKIRFEASGLSARAIMHEIDHLNGKLIIDYVNPVQRFLKTRRSRKCQG